MMKSTLIIAAVLAALLAGPVQAKLTTGGDLMQHCIAAPDDFCAGYVGGVIDTSHALFLFSCRCHQKADNKHRYYLFA